MELWSKTTEEKFFQEALKLTTADKLFYRSKDHRYYAYWPKGYQGSRTTLQSRNSFIGDFSEKFVVDLLQPIARKRDLFAVQGVVCPEIGLTPQSPTDVALCKTPERIQPPKQLVAIFEVKMSIVWNWELVDRQLLCIGDFTSHTGRPGLLRSDSMLKAIGKSINIRVSSSRSANIPIIVLGNTPIAESYIAKVDHLKRFGIVQGFWSLNPSPILNPNTLNRKMSPRQGFLRMDSYTELADHVGTLLDSSYQYFSSMLTKAELGRVIEIADREILPEKKAEKFLELIEWNDHEAHP